MILISALVGIAIDRLFAHLYEFRRYNWFLDYFDWMRGHFGGSSWDYHAGLVLVMVPLWFGVLLVQGWVEDWLFGLAGLLFHVVIFLYCIGPRDLSNDVDTWCEVCDSTDETLRARAASRLLLKDEEIAQDPAESARQVASSVLVGVNDRLFSVLFWFAVLGPVGAVMVRSTSLLYRYRHHKGELGDGVAWLQAVVVWAPARLLAIGYALSGHFDAAIRSWRQVHRENLYGAEGSDRIIAETGLAALAISDTPSIDQDIRAPVHSAMRLVWRTLVIWLVALSLMVLAD